MVSTSAGCCITRFLAHCLRIQGRGFGGEGRVLGGWSRGKWVGRVVWRLVEGSGIGRLCVFEFAFIKMSYIGL
jgi:hypothetical protein